MIVPKPEFRPNPDRAIFVQGEITLELVEALTPQIIKLKQISEPITVYIDSPGGNLYFMRALSRLLHAQSQDFAKVHIITVAVHHAYSAAAALLSAGSYALAYPDSKILFHGGRFTEQAELTAERATRLTQLLKMSNEESVKEVVRGIQLRFLLRFILAGRQFPAIREAQNNVEMSNLDCFLHLISQFLSETALEIVDEAKNRAGRYDELLRTVKEAIAALPPNTPHLEIEATQIKAIVDFEVRLNNDNPEWSFHSEGLDSLLSDFLLFQQAQTTSQSEHFSNWVSLMGRIVITPEQREMLNQIEDEEKRNALLLEIVNTLLQPTWSFFVALCYILHRGENEYLTARDAYWLGLIDEVIGDAALSPFRLMSEDVDEPESVDEPEFVDEPENNPQPASEAAKAE